MVGICPAVLRRPFRAGPEKSRASASELVSLVLGQLDEDDEYLVGLLNDETQPPAPGP